MSGKVIVFNHPLMTHKLTIIRNEVTNTKDFRETVSEIANLMAYEATRELPVKEVEVSGVVDEAYNTIKATGKHPPENIFITEWVTEGAGGIFVRENEVARMC